MFPPVIPKKANSAIAFALGAEDDALKPGSMAIYVFGADGTPTAAEGYGGLKVYKYVLRTRN